MSVLKLMGFEMKQQFRSPILIMIGLILIIFTYSEFNTYIYYYPIQSQSDIEGLQQSGYHSFLYVPQADEDVNGIHTEVIGTVKQVNQNLLRELDGRTLTSVVAQIFADRMQVVSSLLALPLFTFMFDKDRRFRMNELVRTRPIHKYSYVLGKYGGVLLSYLSIITVIGIILNTWVLFKVSGSGSGLTGSFWDMPITLIIQVYPTILYMSAFIVGISLLFSSNVISVPVVLVYVIFSISITAFTGEVNNDVELYSAIIRNDTGFIEQSQVMVLLNRLIYLVATVAILYFAGFWWEKTGRRVDK
ncbi:hypothetical protein PAECIP112173_03221 [Paenibacillus sp. JJ-100]|nr:hypothetical protein PAECIP112173_03221 [Paenibacillus sp. JJ-100]